MMANNNRQPLWDDPLSQEEFFDYLPAVCNALLAGEDVATGFENLRREAQLLLGPAPASLGGDHGSENVNWNTKIYQRTIPNNFGMPKLIQTSHASR
jgi:hypothetical protein